MLRVGLLVVTPALHCTVPRCACAVQVDPRERATASQLLQHPWVALPHSNSTRTRAALNSDEGQG